MAVGFGLLLCSRGLSLVVDSQVECVGWAKFCVLHAADEIGDQVFVEEVGLGNMVSIFVLLRGVAYVEEPLGAVAI